MSYNNYNNNYGSNRNYNNNRNYNGNRNYNSNQPKKPRNGCQHFRGTEDSQCITGWRIDKRHGFMSFKAYPISEKGLKNINSARAKFNKPKLDFEARTKKGRVRQRWFAKVRIGFDFKTVVCFYDEAEGKLYFPQFNMVASHKGSYQNGKRGYFGRISKR